MSSISFASMARNATKTFQKYCFAGLWLLKKDSKSLARQVKVLPFGIQIHVLDLAATISLFHLTKMRCYFLPSGVCKPPPSYLNRSLKVRAKSAFPWLLRGIESTHLQETWIPSLSREDPLDEEMTTHSRGLAWEIPWTEEPGGVAKE